MRIIKGILILVPLGEDQVSVPLNLAHYAGVYCIRIFQHFEDVKDIETKKKWYSTLYNGATPPDGVMKEPPAPYEPIKGVWSVVTTCITCSPAHKLGQYQFRYLARQGYACSMSIWANGCAGTHKKKKSLLMAIGFYLYSMLDSVFKLTFRPLFSSGGDFVR